MGDGDRKGEGAVTDVMLDLETLSSDEDAAIISIGCFEFDLTIPFGPNPELSDHRPKQVFQRNITFDSALKYGKASGSTLEWWFQLPDMARKEVLNDPRSLESALNDLRIWWPRGAQMWSHATFDAPIIHRAFRLAGKGPKRPPWHYRDTKDLRTLTYLAGHRLEDYPDIGELDHVAYADAWQQAVAATRMYERIRG